MRKHDDGGDAEVLRLLWRRHARAVRSVVLTRERNPMDIDEITSDVFALAFKHIDRLKAATDGEVRSWLLRTARYLTLNGVRRSLTRRRLLERLAREPLALAPSPEDEFSALDETASAAEQTAVLIRAFESLRPDYRRVLVLDALGERGPAIGDELGVSAGAARKRLMRARSELRDIFTSLADGTDISGGAERG